MHEQHVIKVTNPHNDIEIYHTTVLRDPGKCVGIPSKL